MLNNFAKFKTELEKLIDEGERLLLRMGMDLKLIEFADKEIKKTINSMKLPSFADNYERWYSLSLQIIKQLLPDRVADFIRAYRDEKRKQIDHATYGVSDYLNGTTVSRGPTIVVDRQAGYPKMQSQVEILKSGMARLESSLFDMLEVVQAHLFDDELEAAADLNKKGFHRCAGAIAGVVLERHLKNVCHKHNVTLRKKNPTINDLNQSLKDAGTIDVPMWRFIQHLGDLRNLSDHDGAREPTDQDGNDLVSGVSKVIKNLM